MFTVTGVHTRPAKDVTFFRESSPLAMWEVQHLQQLQDRAKGFIGRAVHVSHDGLALTTTAMWSDKGSRDRFLRRHHKFLSNFGRSVKSFNNATSSAVTFVDTTPPA